jgi:hypothetical protein
MKTHIEPARMIDRARMMEGSVPELDEDVLSHPAGSTDVSNCSVAGGACTGLDCDGVFDVLAAEAE